MEREKAIEKYRKKPIVIEAVQWTGLNGDEIDKFIKGCPHTYTYNDKGSAIYLDTLEGGHTASSGDWIIKGVKNEFYPCKPDIFEQTYETAGYHLPAEPPQDKAKAVAKLIFISEYPDIPADWSWDTIKGHAPITAPKCELLAKRIIAFLALIQPVQTDKLKVLSDEQILKIDEELSKDKGFLDCPDGDELTLYVGKKYAEAQLAQDKGAQG